MEFMQTNRGENARSNCAAAAFP